MQKAPAPEVEGTPNVDAETPQNSNRNTPFAASGMGLRHGGPPRASRPDRKNKEFTLQRKHVRA
jgi:hypothetical protein